jgi:adenylate cyclase
VTTLNLQIVLSRQGYLIPRSTENLEAYDDLLRGMEEFLSFTETGNVKARPLLESAIKLDPKYAMAYGFLGWNYFIGLALAFNPDADGLERAFRLEQQAVAVDDSLSLAHSALAQIYEMKGQYDQALKEAQRWIALDPNSASAYSSLAMILNTQGRLADALVAVENSAIRARHLVRLREKEGQVHANYPLRGAIRTP